MEKLEQDKINNRSLEKKLQALSLGESVCLTDEEKQQIDNLEEALLDDELASTHHNIN